MKRLISVLLIWTICCGTILAGGFAEDAPLDRNDEEAAMNVSLDEKEEENAAAAPAIGWRDNREEILSQVSAREEKSEKKLRSITLRVMDDSADGLPQEGEAAEAAFLKSLALGLEAKWQLEAQETPEMTPEELLALYGKYTAAELEALEVYRDAEIEDDLMDFLRSAYLIWLDRQAAAAAETQDPAAAVWRWNDARQEALKTLFFLNRYYNVTVHQSFKDQMGSYLYEGALIIDEHTIEKMFEALAASDTASDLNPAEDAVSGNASDPVSTENETVQEMKLYGASVWHAAPDGAYGFRIFDFDSDALTIQAELRETETGKVIPCGAISLSMWEKYKKDRQTLDTFYKADGIEITEGKLIFNLYVNVRFDGRLYREVGAKISLKLPQANAASAAASENTVQENSTSSRFPEAPINQDFSAVQVGDHLFMGYYEQDGNEENLREPIEWIVISINKKKNIGIMVSVMGLEAVSFGAPGDTEAEGKAGFNWSNSYLREWLNDEFYENSFTDAEKERIRLATNVTQDPSGRFTTRDYVFPLSREEAPRYLHTTEGMACMPTPHAIESLDAEGGGIVEEVYCNWWLRELTSAVKVNRDGSLKPGTINEAGFVSGTMGMRHFNRNIGMKVYQDNLVVVRPAMWVKFGN